MGGLTLEWWPPDCRRTAGLAPITMGELVLQLWRFLLFWQDILHRYPLTDIIHFLRDFDVNGRWRFCVVALSADDVTSGVA